MSQKLFTIEVSQIEDIDVMLHFPADKIDVIIQLSLSFRGAIHGVLLSSKV